MKIKEKRLTAHLRLSGFRLLEYDRPCHSIKYVRPSAMVGLFEHVIARASGKRGEAVYADESLSIIENMVMYKDIAVVEMVLLEGCDPERLWTIINSDAEAQEWEVQLANAATQQMQELAISSGQLLLDQTSQIREVVARCLEFFPKSESLESLDAMLRNRASDNQLKEANRLASFPGVVSFPGGEPVFVAGVLALILYLDTAETGFAYGQSPLVNKRLMGEIQLITDRIISACHLNDARTLH